MRVPGGPTTRPRVVLAVDDDEDHLLAYEVAFGKDPELRLITAMSTAAAGAMLAAHRVEAVLLDLAIPDEGGFALCRRIKAQPQLRRIPVIALSALPAAYYAEQALEAGCCAFLQKPSTLAGIVAEVRLHLGLAVTAGAPPLSLAGGPRESRRNGACV